MSLLKTNEIQVFTGTTVTITATITETSADLNVGADLDVTGALTLGTALAIAEGGTGATDAATARTNLDVDQAGTDNSTDVSLVTTSHDYLSIAGQAITLGPIDLAADVTGSLPYASISGTPTLATVATSGAYSDLSGTPTLGTAAAEDVGYFATAAQGSLADSSTQPGDNANTLGSGAATDGYVLTADGAGGAAWEAKIPIDLLSSGASIQKSDGTTAVLSESGGAVTLENTSLGDTVLMPDNSNNVSTAPGIRFEADTDTGIGLASAGNLAVVTGGSERLRVDSNGNVGIGTSGPLAPLNVTKSSGEVARFALSAQTSDSVSVMIGKTDKTTEGLKLTYDGSSGDSTIETVYYNSNLKFKTNSAERIRIDSSGNVNISNLSASSDVQTDASKNLITTSDARLKNYLGVITDSAIKVVQQIIPKYFSWKNDESNSQQLGFFAQDIHPVLPEAAPRALKYIEVGKDENDESILEQVLDEEGNPDYEWGFTDRPIIAMCVKAIQEQQALIESQQSQIDALETRIQALEA